MQRAIGDPGDGNSNKLEHRFSADHASCPQCLRHA
jgi:hypothetical protein